MFKTFIILKYFHIQTSAIKRKYPILIVRIFFVSACTHSRSRYIHFQTLCIHKWNVLRFLQHGTYNVVVRGGSHFCQSPKGGGSGMLSLKRKGGPTLFWEKIPKFPSPPPPRKNVPSLIHHGVTPSSMSLIPILYTWVDSCLRNWTTRYRDWASNHWPSELKSNALTAIPPRPHSQSYQLINHLGEYVHSTSYKRVF